MKKGRKPYQKPQIKEVKLIPEEAVLTNCKSNLGTNKGGTGSGRCVSDVGCGSRLVGS